eukprot:TRINITY_DN59121_c0_g1_i1.p1 TRINITY_DN59121_c0_g1~~TRINITY_DN59121_c0_g1_i1.p1  ORF type:complete len:385 (-),score=57.04 TRINITY_DN59121_c0_g1_i1:24-1178(-)
MSKETATYLKNRASVLWGRPTASFIKGRNKAGSESADSGDGPCSCFDACFGMLLGYPPGGGSSGQSMVYGEPKTLGPVPMPKQWAQIPEERRAGVAVEVLSTAKETMEGWINQDSAMACLPSGCHAADGKGPLFLFGVFDGHGRHGHVVSACASARMPGHLSSQEVHPADQPGKALEESFRSTDNDIYAKMSSDVEYSGSTGVVVLLDRGQNLLTIANVGDSRAVLGQRSDDSKSPRWSALALTTDQKPCLPEEKERIELSGGIVSQYRDERGEEEGPHRVWDSMSQEKPGLAVSRSLGDGAARCIGVIAEPVVTTHKLAAQDRFLLLASDGLWDSVNADEAVRIVAKFLHMPTVALKALTEAVRREEGDELVDDTTMVLVMFP